MRTTGGCSPSSRETTIATSPWSPLSARARPPPGRVRNRNGAKDPLLRPKRLGRELAAAPQRGDDARLVPGRDQARLAAWALGYPKRVRDAIANARRQLEAQVAKNPRLGAWSGRPSVSTVVSQAGRTPAALARGGPHQPNREASAIAEASACLRSGRTPNRTNLSRASEPPRAQIGHAAPARKGSQRRNSPISGAVSELSSWRRRESNPRPRPYRPNVYERSPRFGLTRRPVRRRPTGGPALLECRASGEWLSLGA